MQTWILLCPRLSASVHVHSCPMKGVHGRLRSVRQYPLMPSATSTMYSVLSRTKHFSAKRMRDDHVMHYADYRTVSWVHTWTWKWAIIESAHCMHWWPLEDVSVVGRRHPQLHVTLHSCPSADTQSPHISVPLSARDSWRWLCGKMHCVMHRYMLWYGLTHPLSVSKTNYDIDIQCHGLRLMTDW